MKDGIDGEISRVADPQVRNLLRQIRHEYKDRTSPLSIAMALSIVAFWLMVIGGLIFFVTKFGNNVAKWFVELSGGFTKLGVISLGVGTIGLLSIPAAYGFGRSRGRKKSQGFS